MPYGLFSYIFPLSHFQVYLDQESKMKFSGELLITAYIMFITMVLGFIILCMILGRKGYKKTLPFKIDHKSTPDS
ncbi:MAG: hypothetical protein DWB56_15715 [Candidatus Jettenia sp.]|nr:MAG: hypothetical protein EDM77_15910 [Candidatus Jettenia sp. AMX1]MBC6930377.1 hypothetical protein [Candidatus Jettenia sp.]MCE7881981.1 hypothetical protein [Candidatus Jettenia sp. AMX1]MCQ3928558.1 hypothetical protein [Candidatus Jettenia sp.]